MLAPSSRRLIGAAAVLLPEGLPLLSSSDVEQSLDPFTTVEQAALLLANRYDGIDLPHDACRLIILTGLPAGTHLQERFLFDELGARHVLSERIRTRITQGAGRATRARRDTAVVILHGDDLIGFLNHSEVRQVLRSELQAELELAFVTSGNSNSEVLASVDSFLSQDQDWQPTEAWLRSVAQERPREPAPGSAALKYAVEHEIAAWEAAWRGDYSTAVQAAQRPIAALSDSATASYRAWWLSLAASWAIAEHDEVNTLASELIRQAGRASQKMRWRPQLPSVSESPTASSDDALLLRADSAAQWLRNRVRSPKLERELKQLDDDITAADATRFELALECLGEVLGLESIRPAENTAPDGIWRDGDSAWLIFEAKTEKSDSELSAKEIRQANSHENWINHRYAWPEPEHAITAIIADGSALHDDAAGVANDSLYLASQETIQEISEQAIAAHRELAGEIVGLSDDESTQRLAARFAQLGLSTPDLIKRLTDTPLS